ncbi:MAG: N-acetyltransferase [Propionibacteriaceae bacterium]|nr:N-acetyltransferase [Propionibacteriaceae bacterium]
MDFRITDSRFEAVGDGQVVGWLDFTNDNGMVSMTHTVVPSKYEGRGIGTSLVAHALNYARDHDWQVLPYCSFIQAYIVTHEGYLQLVPKDRRAEFVL